MFMQLALYELWDYQRAWKQCAKRFREWITEGMISPCHASLL